MRSYTGVQPEIVNLRAGCSTQDSLLEFHLSPLSRPGLDIAAW